jgi:DNA-binding CsgD family transcriptional regulator
MRRTNKRHAIRLSKLPKRSYAARDRALHVLAAMRANSALSLAQAAKREGVKPRTVTKYLGSALRKSDGKFVASKSDRFAAVLNIPNAEAKLVPVKTRSSKDRTALGEYLRDIGRYLRGDVDALARWRGKSIADVQLVTDERTILDMEPMMEDFSLYRAIQ